jgi:hypothetical protein
VIQNAQGLFVDSIVDERADRLEPCCQGSRLAGQARLEEAKLMAVACVRTLERLAVEPMGVVDSDFDRSPQFASACMEYCPSGQCPPPTVVTGLLTRSHFTSSMALSCNCCTIEQVSMEGGCQA